MDRGSDEGVGGAGGIPAGQPVVVPDDARELARDVEAWRREQRWERRRRVLERKFFGGPNRSGAMSAPLVIAVLLAVAMLGATIVSSADSPARHVVPPVALALAAPTAAVGSLGGLVPDADLTASTGTTPARVLRPAVLAFASADCGCASALAHLADEAAGNGLTIYLIGPVAQHAELATLSDEVGRADITVLADPSGTFASALSRGGLTVVAVHADGVIGAFTGSFSRAMSLDPVFADLKEPAHAGA
jgi:hypothetical protein